MTRLPQLEQELVAAATRLQGPRRVVTPVRRAALAVVAALVAVLLVVAIATDDPGEPGGGAAATVPFPPGAELEDMLAVFRRPATEADDAGITRSDINDRQPGEDPARSRRVRSPDATIFLWPGRDRVCSDVDPKRSIGSGSGCVPLDHLRRQGATVGIQTSEGRRSIYGIVVDGIHQMVLTAPGGRERRVGVTDNFFFVDLGTDTPVAEVSWRYGGRRRSFDASPILGVLDPPPPPQAPEGAPDPRIEPRLESASVPLEFEVAGTRYRAVGFQTERAAVCTALTDLDAARPSGHSCLSGRLLRDALESRPALLFASGGGGAVPLVHTGFARADVVEIAPAERADEVTVILSEPWRPEPWEGEPIRFFFAFDRGAGTPAPGRPSRVSLEARLRDGRVVRIP